MRLNITCWLFLTINILTIIIVFGQSCNYIKNVPVKYARFSESLNGRIVISDECISDASLKADKVKYISIECQAADKLPTIKANFIANMKNLERITIKDCNVSTLEPRAFNNLPKIKAILIQDNHLTHIPKGVFDILPTLSKIALNSNNISTIEDDAFANLPQLIEFHLSNNKLTFISRRWFTNTTNIRRILIYKNQIQEVPQGMFMGWKQAYWFDFSWNMIHTIHKDAFKDIAPNVEYLNLYANKLKEIDISCFPTVFIRELSLGVNLLNYIPETFIWTIQVRNLNIMGNPFKCQCLEKLYASLSELQIHTTCGDICLKKCKKSSVPVCASSSNSDSQKVCIETIDEEVTNKTMNYVKSLGYADMRDWPARCALET